MPIVLSDLCRGVFEMNDGVAVAIVPMECAVGCTTCGNICPTNAISFPSLDAVWRLERERQIFRTVKKEALQRHEREEMQKARQAAQQFVQQVSTRAAGSRWRASSATSSSLYGSRS